jgi:hypothetical protein
LKAGARHGRRAITKAEVYFDPKPTSMSNLLSVQCRLSLCESTCFRRAKADHSDQRQARSAGLAASNSSLASQRTSRPANKK